MKKVWKGISVGALGLLVFDLVYRWMNRYDAKDAFEEDLNTEQALLDLQWVSEKDYPQQMTEQVLPYLEKRILRRDYLLVQNDRLAYVHYAPKRIQQTVVITHGFNEFKERYLELIYYFLQSGIEVFVYDLHGHGESRKDLSSSLINVNNYQVYVDDLHQFMHQVVLKERAQEAPLVLFGHSMGGAIVSKYLMDYPQMATGLILNAPMFSVITEKVPLSLTHAFTLGADVIGKDQSYFYPMTAYDPDLHYDFTMKSGANIRENYYQHTKLRTYQTPTWGGSYRWLRQSIELSHAVSKHQELRSLDLPTLLWRAENDHLVNKKGIQQATNYLPQARTICVPEGRHNLFLESDCNLYPYVSETIRFIQDLTL